jgi:hypothetical protein
LIIRVSVRRPGTDLPPKNQCEGKRGDSAAYRLHVSGKGDAALDLNGEDLVVKENLDHDASIQREERRML